MGGQVICTRAPEITPKSGKERSSASARTACENAAKTWIVNNRGQPSCLCCRSVSKGVTMRDAQQSGHPGLLCPEVLAGVSHGSHVCAFYETKDDLMDLVLPFFAAGAERDELCVWMTPDFVSGDEARGRASVAALERGIEFHRERDVYLSRGRFARDRIGRFWDQAIQQARSMNRSE